MAADDTPLNPIELLAELDWLRRLARSLVGNVGADQDLVQQTWLAASRVEGGVSRPWLVNTLRRLAARWHRTESRLRRREQAVAKPEAVETESLLERNELLSVVLGEVRRVEEPFRTTLLLIYQEGLSVRDAAVRLGLKEDTLRWRHRRGLELLRGQLDREARPDWRVCLLPLVGGPGLVSGSTAATATATATGAAIATTSTATKLTLLGGVLMKLKLTSSAVLAAALVLGVAIPLAVWGTDDTPVELPADVVAASDADAQESTSETEQAPSLSSESTSDSTRRGAAAPSQPAPTLTASAPPTSGDILAVTVLDARQQPIPAARVWIGKSPDPVDAFWESDAQGIARLPMPDGSSHTISGSTGDLYGTRPILKGFEGGEVDLRLLSDGDVTVVVVDEAGVPVPEVPVGLVRTNRIKAHGNDYERDILTFREAVETDAEGRAVLRHVNHAVAGRGTAEWWVGPAVLLAERNDVRVQFDELPREPITLVLPPVGSLNLRALDDQGAINPRAEKVRVMIDPEPARERDVEALVDAARFAVSGIVEVELNDGRASLPMVGLDLQLLAEARGAEATGSTLGLGPGPTTAQPEAELSLEPQDMAVEIVGHALDTARTPIANAEFLCEISLWRRERVFASPPVDVFTDADGRFRVFIDEDMRVDWERAERCDLHLMQMGDGPTQVIGASCALPAQLSLGANDVGELILEPQTPLLAGTAATADGVPADIQYLWLIVENQLGKSRERYVREVRRVFDGARFAVFGDAIDLDPTVGEMLKVRISTDDRPGIERVVVPGDVNLSFVFEDPGYLEGRVLLQEGQNPEDYFAYFRTPKLEGDFSSHSFVELAQNGRFKLSKLPLRRGDVEIRDWDTKTLLAVVPGIDPSREPHVEHPSLGAIELNAAVDEFSLRVTDVEGNAIVAARFGSERISQERSPDGDGRFVFRAAGGSIAGTVTAPGYRTQSVMLMPGDQALTLQRGPEVIIRPSPEIKLPREARLSLMLLGSASPETVYLRDRGDGSYSAFVSGDGEYQVRGGLKRGRVLVAELPLSAEPMSSIQVSGASAAAQEFEVPFDRAAFEASWSRSAR